MELSTEDIRRHIAGHVRETEGNRVGRAAALTEDVAGMRLYDEPILAFGDASDPLFRRLKELDAVGPHFMAPAEWLADAATVISIFLPATREVRTGNSLDMSRPSPGWLHARYEGQAMIAELAGQLVAWLTAMGHGAVAPVLDGRFRANEGGPGQGIPMYSSTWSERHAAFVCGLGTFGLSRGLITRRGTAGRLTSVITSLQVPHDVRPYAGLHEYCAMCGECARNCPVGAITLEHGKDHRKCSAFLDETRKRFAPRYGCGKCQVRVPCEEKACRTGD